MPADENNVCNIGLVGVPFSKGQVRLYF